MLHIIYDNIPSLLINFTHKICLYGRGKCNLNGIENNAYDHILSVYAILCAFGTFAAFIILFGVLHMHGKDICITFVCVIVYHIQSLLLNLCLGRTLVIL